jgi:2-iminoacetate synthase ThiH
MGYYVTSSSDKKEELDKSALRIIEDAKSQGVETVMFHGGLLNNVTINYLLTCGFEVLENMEHEGGKVTVVNIV